MSSIIYNWRRYWCVRGGRLNLSDGGYLVDPESQYGRFISQDIYSYPEISTLSCLVLLGEPGIGKTTALKEIEKSEAKEYQIVKLDLGEFSSDERLFRYFFEGEAVKCWLDGTHILSVIIDSLDECRIPAIPKVLGREFARMPTERMRLRIACRTIQWPMTLEESLIETWGNDNVGVYELSPLLMKNVVEAATQEGIPPDDFLSEIAQVRAQPLAIKPVSLQFLLNHFRANRQLPSEERTLYHQGCFSLCEDSQERKEAGVPRVCEAEQRFEVAQRIAYLTIFSGKFSVWTGPQDGRMPADDVTVIELLGTEACHDHIFDVNEAVVRDTLNTGLFSARGAYRIGWAHQTYAEFLASQYLLSRLNTRQRHSLLFLVDSVGADVVPQLSEVAARIASVDDGLFQEIIKISPNVLLRSDVATADYIQRSALLTAILKKCNAGDIHFRDLDDVSRLRHLNHPDIVEQLRPFVSENTFDYNARALALCTIKACNVDGLQAELVNLALDDSASIDLRCSALNSIAKCIDVDFARRIRPLADGIAEDPDFRIKGSALRALWPRFLTAEELFALITPKRRDRLTGAYDLFLGHVLINTLRSQDMGAALAWVSSQGRRNDFNLRFRKFLDNVIVAAWNQMDEPGVLELLADALGKRLIIDRGQIIDRRLSNESGFLVEDRKRRALLTQIISKVEGVDNDVLYYLSSHCSSLSKPSDFTWIVDNVMCADTSAQAEIWARLCLYNYNMNVFEETYTVLAAYSESSAIRKEFEPVFKPIEIDSPRAQKLKESYYKYDYSSRENEGPPLLDPPPAVRVQRLIDRCEAGEPCLWWCLVRELTLEPRSTHYNDDDLWQPAMTGLPGWQAADEFTRSRISEAAKSYVLNCDDLRAEWLASGSTIRYESHAGYQALRLIHEYDPRFIEDMPADAWDRWGVALLFHPLSLTEEESEQFHALFIEQMFRTTPSQSTKALAEILKRESDQSGGLGVLHRIEHVRCFELSAMLKNFVLNEPLKADGVASVLRCLMAQDAETYINWILSLVTMPIPNNQQDRDRALGAADALCSPASAKSWAVIWTAMCHDNEFGRSFVGRLASFSRSDLYPLEALTDEQLADLYIWVSREFPHSEDPKFDGAHAVGMREEIADWRDQYLLQALKNRGTITACYAINKITTELPQLPWLRFTWHDAVKIMRSQTWQPLSLSELLKLAQSDKARAVSSGESLLKAVQESLDRLQEKLQGMSPSVPFLWDYQREKKTWCPKDENSLSEFVAKHLQEDMLSKGVIVNREVQIRPLRGIEPGQRTDILIEAVIKPSRDDILDLIHVIVETKGCWHHDLKTAMENQLVGRYLKDNQCRHGLYLVGYFLCDSWDDLDYRKNDCPKESIDELTQLLNSQTKELSTDGFCIEARVLDIRLN